MAPIYPETPTDSGVSSKHIQREINIYFENNEPCTFQSIFSDERDSFKIRVVSNHWGSFFLLKYIFKILK